MGALLALYLQKNPDRHLLESVEKYAEFVQQKMVDLDTGEVYNDIGHTHGRNVRRYNYPWFALFFIELYNLKHDTQYLRYTVNIIRDFYRRGSTEFYPIMLPAVWLCEALQSADMILEYKEMLGYFKAHADRIIEKGTAYPASELNFEQSIVAPAADVLLQVYLLTKEEKYFTEGEKQLKILELFNGMQPDYHLYETAIRHWDGYWFGKRKLFGDTFPHYWSALTGNVYLVYADITGSEEYKKKAEASLRGVLSMFSADGRGSCAYIYPYSVNGIKTDFPDPLANDQDWGLYFMMKHLQN